MDSHKMKRYFVYGTKNIIDTYNRIFKSHKWIMSLISGYLICFAYSTVVLGLAPAVPFSDAPVIEQISIYTLYLGVFWTLAWLLAGSFHLIMKFFKKLGHTLKRLI